MKKNFGLLAFSGMVISIVVLLAANTVYAKSLADTPNPGTPPSGGEKMWEPGLLHDEAVTAIASLLGISKTDLETRLKAGERLEDIAVKQGIAKADWPAKLKAALTAVIKAAVTSGKITQAQADMLLKRLDDFGNPDKRFNNGTPPPTPSTPFPTPNGPRPTPNPQTPPPNQQDGKPPMGPGPGSQGQGQGQNGPGNQGGNRPGNGGPGGDIFGGLF